MILNGPALFACHLLYLRVFFHIQNIPKKQEIASFTVPVIRLAAAVFHNTQAKSFHQKSEANKTNKKKRHVDVTVDDIHV